MSRPVELSLAICKLELRGTSNIDLYYYAQSLEISLFSKHGNRWNFPFETEDDSNFRLSLILKDVPKFASRADIPKHSQAIIFTANCFTKKAPYGALHPT